MRSDKEQTTLIEKEIINQLQFPAQEVLADKLEIEQRTAALHQATSLGNLEKHKVFISFLDAEGIKQVYTTIWAVTDNKAILKGGRVIPVNRILSVRIS